LDQPAGVILLWSTRNRQIEEIDFLQTLLYLEAEACEMTNQDWRKLAHQELDMAEAARQSGNEGRARVCARRAAGHVIGEYLSRRNSPVTTESALERLRYLYSSPEIDLYQREIIEHFLIHTTPEHDLPIDADLIADVDLLAQLLLGEELK
jgi:hypothetical protein